MKELISEILNENDEKKSVLLKEKKSLEQARFLQKRNEYRLQYCEDTSRIVMQLEREFDMIERKYNKLIEQKTVFAKRALVRIHYILQEGVSEEDNIIKLINLLDRSEKKDEILVEMRERIRFSSQFKNITDNSFAGRRDRGDGAFTPVMLDEEIDAKEQHMTDFVPKPLYTRNELQSFRRKIPWMESLWQQKRPYSPWKIWKNFFFSGRKRRRSVLRKIQCRWMARYGVRTD